MRKFSIVVAVFTLALSGVAARAGEVPGAELCRVLKTASSAAPEFTALRGPKLGDGLSYDSTLAPFSTRGAFGCAVQQGGGERPTIFSCTVHTTDIEAMRTAMAHCFPGWKVLYSKPDGRAMYSLLNPANPKGIAIMVNASNADYLTVRVIPPDPQH